MALFFYTHAFSDKNDFVRYFKMESYLIFIFMNINHGRQEIPSLFKFLTKILFKLSLLIDFKGRG